MAHEIELKLALGALAPQALRNHSLLAGTSPRRLHLCNSYFDTPGGELQAAGMALRLRHDGKSYRQTLKTRGHSLGGLSRRGEWEWEVPGPALDLDGLAALPALADVSRQALSRLTPVFTTDFQREAWLLKSPRAHIEVALDLGEIRAGQRRVPIRELELELKSGDPEVLLDLAQSLAEQVSMRPSDTSKATRGNVLRGQPWQLPPLDAPLQRALVALDALADTGNPIWQEQARQALMVLADSTDDAVSQPARALMNALGFSRPDAQPGAQEHAQEHVQTHARSHVLDNDGWNMHCSQHALRLIRCLTPSPAP
jgi:inorganic triphosphatase YgiF